MHGSSTSNVACQASHPTMNYSQPLPVDVIQVLYNIYFDEVDLAIF
jgi:hypothetical protein